VATDSFMVNLQSVLLRFAEPFMDAKYSKVGLLLLNMDYSLISAVQMDRIDIQYFAHSSRINVKDETRIKATSDEASAWVEENASPNGSVHFISCCGPSIDASDKLGRRALRPTFFI
jgi:ubiquitin conjugation factor E4 B